MDEQLTTMPEQAVTTTIRQYLPFLLSPVGMALVLYLAAFIPLLILPALAEFGMLFLFAIIIAFTAFSAISPIINIFRPRWWLNTVLYIVSWFLLFYGMIGTLTLSGGKDASIVAIGFGPAMMVAVVVLPITAVVRLIMYISSRSEGGL
jgi:hypothetical protein